MFLSIRRIFFNLKVFLLFLSVGIGLLSIQLFLISAYGERLSALKNQRLLIEKIVNTDLTADPQMATILLKGAVAEVELSVKLSGQETFLDGMIRSNEEQASLLRSLTISAQAFRENALAWSEATQLHQVLEKERMMAARTEYLSDIGRMVDYQIHAINETIATAKVSSMFVFLVGLYTLFFYRYRLDLVYRDIEQLNSVDIDGSKKEVKTEEMDYILKRLSRKSLPGQAIAAMIHPLTGLNTEKGMVAAWNSKKGRHSANMLYLSLFAFDRLTSLSQTLSDGDMELLYKKLAGIVTMYEQPLDIVAHLESGEIALLMSRNNKQDAFDDCAAIVRTMEAAGFVSQNGPIKISLSAAFLAKLPAKSIEDTIEEGLSLIDRAQEKGGNRIAQPHDRVDMTRNS